MKVRVKLGSRSQTILFEQQEASAVHLQDLRQSVIREFNLQDQDFQLSLNRSDALSGDDQTLDAFGIVSGDLLHIIGYSLPVVSQARHDGQINNRAQPLGQYYNHDSVVSSHQAQVVREDPSNVGHLPGSLVEDLSSAMEAASICVSYFSNILPK